MPSELLAVLGRSVLDAAILSLPYLRKGKPALHRPLQQSGASWLQEAGSLSVVARHPFGTNAGLQAVAAPLNGEFLARCCLSFLRQSSAGSQFIGWASPSGYHDEVQNVERSRRVLRQFHEALFSPSLETAYLTIKVSRPLVCRPGVRRVNRRRSTEAPCQPMLQSCSSYCFTDSGPGCRET